MKTKPEHEIAFQEMVALCQRMADQHNLTSLQLLAVAGNMIGKLLALQDQRCVTPARAMGVLSENIKIGNKQAIAEIMKSQGNA